MAGGRHGKEADHARRCAQRPGEQPAHLFAGHVARGQQGQQSRQRHQRGRGNERQPQPAERAPQQRRQHGQHKQRDLQREQRRQQRGAAQQHGAGVDERALAALFAPQRVPQAQPQPGHGGEEGGPGNGGRRAPVRRARRLDLFQLDQAHVALEFLLVRRGRLPGLIQRDHMHAALGQRRAGVGKPEQRQQTGDEQRQTSSSTAHLPHPLSRKTGVGIRNIFLTLMLQWMLSGCQSIFDTRKMCHGHKNARNSEAASPLRRRGG